VASGQAGVPPNKRDAEDAEPRLTARPRRTRYNRRVRCAVRDVVSADAFRVMGTATGHHFP